MDDEIVYLSLTCPVCQKITAVPYARFEIAEMLSPGTPFLLYSPCHTNPWRATDEDRKAMRALIGGFDGGAEMTPAPLHAG